MNTQKTKAGRKPLPVGRKKMPYTIFLIPGEVEALEKKYGTLTLAMRSLIVQDKPELLPNIDKAIEILTGLRERLK